MTSKDPRYQTIAKAVRLEFDKNDNIYIVFKITDERLKNKVREDWLDDPELEIIGKELIFKE